MIDNSIAVDALRSLLFVVVFAVLIGIPVVVIAIAFRLNRKLDRVLEILKAKS